MDEMDDKDGMRKHGHSVLVRSSNATTFDSIILAQSFAHLPHALTDGYTEATGRPSTNTFSTIVGKEKMRIAQHETLATSRCH